MIIMYIYFSLLVSKNLIFADIKRWIAIFSSKEKKSNGFQWCDPHCSIIIENVDIQHI
jgi:hypothetical protein